MKFSTSIRIVLIAAVLSLGTVGVEAAPVNINSANAQAIAKALNCIGMKKAQAIIAYRESHGPFKSVEALKNVKGIGAVLIERNRKEIRLGMPPKKS